MMKLKLGKMTSREIAEWFGRSYYSYRNNIDKYLDQLGYYCEFEKVYGGITTIYQMSSALGYSKYAIRKACNFCFGEGLKSSGPLGSKKKVWAMRRSRAH